MRAASRKEKGLFDRLLLLPLGFFGLMVIGVLTALAIEVTLPELIAAMVGRESLFALRLSLLVSLAAIVLAVAIGVPSAYFLSRNQFPGKAVLDICLDLPLVMPPLVAGVGLLFLFGQGMLGPWLARVGIHVIFSPIGAVAAQTFIATPILIRSSRAAFESVDRGYEEAARTLGLGSFKIFAKINLPLAGRGILAAVILAWTRALGEFGATLLVAGATRFHTETLPIGIYLNISSGEMSIAISCALVLLAVAVVLLLVLHMVQRGYRRRAAVMMQGG